MTDLERDVSFSTLIERLEVGRFPNDDDSEETVWNLHLVGSDADDDNRFVVVSGYLRRNGTEGFGQVIASGLIDGVSLEEEEESPERWTKFVDFVRQYFAEVIYDTARRALQSQAAQMDFMFDLNTKAPDVDIHRPVTRQAGGGGD